MPLVGKYESQGKGDDDDRHAATPAAYRVFRDGIRESSGASACLERHAPQLRQHDKGKWD
jgi:hypothetical protein